MTSNASMIPVYVQTDVDEAVYFTDWPVGDLESVLDLIRSWGLVDSDGEDTNTSGACADLIVLGKRVVFRVSLIVL